ncbi:cytochrome c-type biogenesis protein CcmE [Roseovarius halotolerans]|uniref:Cytochrome c-type biogenesis protein CcmE n=1 Tax=Roseovarius halotolerans TaxID=505353 RepID=A0A1X6YJT3_9RHOB|nr:cytochrome c maturation protein CcmE [Roseovarius halotolerans]RKT34506.1 cytochrome c-type biogenesis protein CcmE [Roseovarius halotolerans]SLN22545.1 Cytochrome c-type biogenesis protein CcmE [Roseovarius halotolerans]
MKSLKKKRRVQVIVLAALALVASVSLIGFAFKDGINYFRSPSEVLAEPPGPTEVFRIGGLVEDGSLERGAGETIRFNVTDGGAAVPVTYRGVLPDLFEENQGMVGMGSLRDGVFEATEILAKHDEDYMPKEVVDALKAQGVYQEPEAEYNGHAPDSGS